MKETIQLRLARERAAKQIKDNEKKEQKRFIDMKNEDHGNMSKKEIIFEKIRQLMAKQTASVKDKEKEEAEE